MARRARNQYRPELRYAERARGGRLREGAGGCLPARELRHRERVLAEHQEPERPHHEPHEGAQAREGREAAPGPRAARHLRARRVDARPRRGVRGGVRGARWHHHRQRRAPRGAAAHVRRPPEPALRRRPRGRHRGQLPRQRDRLHAGSP